MTHQSHLLEEVARGERDPQDDDIFSAILDFLSDVDVLFTPTLAQKEHLCVMGCEIETGDSFFALITWLSREIFCVSCVAALVYDKNQRNSSLQNPGAFWPSQPLSREWERGDRQVACPP